MRGAVHSGSAPRFILKKLVEAYPTVTDSPVKALIINRTKNTRQLTLSGYAIIRKTTPADIGFTVGTALLAIAAEPNRHANGHDQQHECRCRQPGKRKHNANAHSNNRKQQQAASTPTGTINGRLLASPHRHSNLNIFEHYNAIAC